MVRRSALDCHALTDNPTVEAEGNAEAIDNPLHDAAKRGNVPYLEVNGGPALCYGVLTYH